MNALNPYGWLLLLALPILYLLSKRYKQIQEVTVPSLKLWIALLENKQEKKTLKHAPSYLFLIQCLLLVLATMGLLDLYKTWTEDDQIVLLYDTSFSTESIHNKDPLYDFIKGHAKKNFQVIFIDTVLDTDNHIVDRASLLSVINEKSPSNKPLDMSLLLSTYEAYKNQNKAVLLISDKEELINLGVDPKDLLILPRKHKNIGIRNVRYNPRNKLFTVTVESESDLSLGQELIIENGERLLYQVPLILSPYERRTVEINTSELEPISPSLETVVTIRLGNDDDNETDNVFYCGYLKKLGVQLEENNPALETILDLVDYVEPSANGVDTSLFIKPPKSDVTYDPTIISAIEEKGLKDKSVIVSPYYPLWIEDHLYQRYKVYLDNLLQKFPKDNPPKSYVINLPLKGIDKEVDQEKSTLDYGYKKSISTVFIFIGFICLMLIEEEVRKYV